MNPEIIGMLAAILTTAAYIPQTVKVLRTRNTRDLSLGMYIMITSGIFCWLLYGIMLESLSLIFANGISVALSGLILFMKIRHG